MCWIRPLVPVYAFSEFEGQAHVERKCTGAWNPPETPQDFRGTRAELRDEEERKAYAKGFTEAFNSIRAHVKCTNEESETEAQRERERLFNDVLKECCKRAGQTFVKDQWKERIRESKNVSIRSFIMSVPVEEKIEKYLESLR